MKRILSERNIAGFLFIIVMVVFSFAHEYSKKRNAYYISSFPSVSSKTTTALNTTSENGFGIERNLPGSAFEK